MTAFSRGSIEICHTTIGRNNQGHTKYLIDYCYNLQLDGDGVYTAREPQDADQGCEGGDVEVVRVEAVAQDTAAPGSSRRETKIPPHQPAPTPIFPGT